VGVGGRRAWEQDVFIPRKYGIYQPVGDTVMPGGTSRALRMIPAMVGIAQDVLDLCPQALFFNYGNPMSPVCRGIRKATGANVVGLCHGVNDVGKWLARQLGVTPERVRYDATGINHLTWFTEYRVDGQDAMPRLMELARRKLSECESLGEVSDPFTWQMTELFGAFPAVLDRHICEFFPHLFAKQGSYFGKTLGVEKDAYSFECTIEFGDRIFAEMSEQALSPDPLPADYFQRIGGEHEQVLDIVSSVRRDTGDVYSSNLPNQGQVPNLPHDAVIEGPSIATASGVRAIAQPPLSPGLAGTLATRFEWVETVVDAALSGDRKKVVQALLIDGAVDTVEMAYRLAEDLLKAQAAFLPQFNTEMSKAD
jgi:alpha-galactosidase